MPDKAGKRASETYARFEVLLISNKTNAYRVSKALGFGKSDVYNWKKGIYTPGYDKLISICKYFGVPLDYFSTEE